MSEPVFSINKALAEAEISQREHPEILQEAIAQFRELRATPEVPGRVEAGLRAISRITGAPNSDQADNQKRGR